MRYFSAVRRALHTKEAMMKRYSTEAVKVPGVYHSLESVLSALRESQDLDVVRELQHIYERSKAGSKDSGKRYPFIVVEGLDGCGKSVIADDLSRHLKGEVMRTPPASILPLREKFDSMSENVRRAYYALGNYIAAEEVRQKTLSVPVVMDRFWHSTCVYAVANNYLRSKTFVKDQDIFTWPTDLLKPDMVIFLHVDEKVRNIRLQRRYQLLHQQPTAEEKDLEEDNAYRNIVLEGYQLIKDPAVVMVDSTQLREVTLDLAAKEVEKVFTTLDSVKGK